MAPATNFNAILIHRCSVERLTPSQSGSGEVEGTWAVVLTSVACRLVRKVERYAAERMSAETLKDELVLTKASYDIRPGDRLTTWTWASDGATYDVGTYVVLNRLQRNVKTAHHAALEVEQIG